MEKDDFKTIKHKNIVKRNEVNLFQSFFMVALILFALIGMICVWYYGKVNETIKQEASGYLQEIVFRIENNIERVIDNTYQTLYTIDSTFEDEANLTFDNLKQVSDFQRTHWDFKNLIFIDSNGYAYNESGNSVFLSGGEVLQQAVVNHEKGMSPLQMVDGEECSIFTIPIQNRTINGIDMVALAVTLNPGNISQLLNMTSFNNQAYSNIVSKDGTLIISSDSSVKANFGYNILSSIESTNTVTQTEMNKIRNDLLSSNSGQTTFTFNGREESMVYCPISTTDWFLLTFVPTDVINAKSDLLMTITFLISGFIILAFSILIALLVFTFKRYQNRLEHIAYVDSVTSGNTIERFYELAEIALSKNVDKRFALVYTNLEKFKIFNENFGRSVGDEILRTLYMVVGNTLHDDECIGRLGADNFCVLIEYEDFNDIRNRIDSWYRAASLFVRENKTVWSLPTGQFGIYLIDDITMKFPLMIDRAKLALRENPQSLNSKIHYAVYSESVRNLLLREKQLEDMMEDALENHEFKMFLQPKYSVLSETIIGAEALARWKAPEGMIYPNEFIPLFEKNGFITQLDLYMFEQLCILMRKWIDEKKPQIIVSINCSRTNLKNANFLEDYIRIKKNYNIPDRIIEIELTESIVLEDAEHFKQVVSEIHDAGFGCSMDDFGSGYSSLNMIQEITVDTLKLDKVFFSTDNSNNLERTESVVRNIVRMANELSMKTVAEGVEYPEQLKMLKRIGCNIIQGYIYARPMPVEEFERKWETELRETINDEK